MKRLLVAMLLAVSLWGQAPTITTPWSFRTPKNRIEYVPMGAQNWFTRLDPMYDKVGEVYPLFAPYIGYVTKIMIFPTQGRGRTCDLEVKYGVVEAPEGYWIIVAPNIPEESRDAVLEEAFGTLFKVWLGRAKPVAFPLPGCVD